MASEAPALGSLGLLIPTAARLLGGGGDVGGEAAAAGGRKGASLPTAHAAFPAGTQAPDPVEITETMVQITKHVLM